MIDKKEVAKKINVTLATIYNWYKTKPELIKMIEEYYKKIETEGEENELLKYFYQLDADRQELYLTKIKLEALEKKEKEK